jgi:tetratricopeptide (TPR) repeat protein
MFLSHRLSWEWWVGVMLLCFFSLQLARRYHDPFPALNVSLSTPESSLQDLGGIALGARRLTADVAWIQTLEYYGTPEEGQSESDFENGIGQYPEFLHYCQRVARLDPYFIFIYYYGGAALGWNLNRLDEAEELLKEGVGYNPKEWRLQQYLAGLAYQKNHDVKNLTLFLESFVNGPDCPNMVRGLLANIYKKQHRYEKSIQIWMQVRDTGDPQYTQRALHEIAILKDLIDRYPPSLVH